MRDCGFYLNESVRLQLMYGTYQSDSVYVFICGFSYREDLSYIDDLVKFFQASPMSAHACGSSRKDIRVAPILAPACCTGVLGNSSVSKAGHVAIYVLFPASYVKKNIASFGVL